MGRPLVEIGQTVPVGTPLAELEIVGATDEAAPARAGDSPPSPAAPAAIELPLGRYCPPSRSRGSAVNRASPRLPRGT